MKKKISFVGLGKLGLPLATNFAKNGHKVLAIDKNSRLIEILTAGKEPWLEVGLLNNIKEARKNISYTTGYVGVADTDITVILVNTPSIKKDGSFSNLFVEQSIQSICRELEVEKKKNHHIILSSTVMPGSINNDFIPLIKSLTNCKVSFSYVPDFVAIGQVISDFENPDFLLIGSDSEKSSDVTKKLYKSILKSKPPIKQLTLAEAELCKVSLNAYVTTKISFANYLGLLANKIDPNINVDNITDTIGLDARIGTKYFKSGGPYGGTCFPRDTWAFAKVSEKVGLESFQMFANEKINDQTDKDIYQQVMNNNPTSIGLVGLGFKPGTSVITEGVAIKLIEKIKNYQCKIYLYDRYSDTIDNIIAEYPDLDFVDCRISNYTLKDVVSACDSILFCNGDRVYLEDNHFGEVDMFEINTKNVIDPWRML